MYSGVPGTPSDMSSPKSSGGEPSMWKGPSTVAGVAAASDRWFIWTTSMDRPRTSDARMNSSRFSSLICPARVSHRMAVIHSASVSRTSRAKSCRCRTRAVRTSAVRGSRAVPQRSTARSVMFSSLTSCTASSWGDGGGSTPAGSDGSRGQPQPHTRVAGRLPPPGGRRLGERDHLVGDRHTAGGRVLGDGGDRRRALDRGECIVGVAEDLGRPAAQAGGGELGGVAGGGTEVDQPAPLREHPRGRGGRGPEDRVDDDVDVAADGLAEARRELLDVAREWQHL